MEILGALILGWVCGMLVNYLADILPVARIITTPICLDCSQKYSWQDYLLFKSCKSCGRRRHWRTWAVQVFLVAALVWMAIRPPALLGFWFGSLLMTYFCLVAVIDLEYKAILLPTTYFGAVLCLSAGIYVRGPVDSVLGGIAGLVIMFVLYKLGEVFVKVMGRIRRQEIDEVALGQGDVFLMGVLGLLMGPYGVVGGLILSLLAGGLVSGLIVVFAMLLRRDTSQLAIPYAPFLLFGAWIMTFIPKTLN